MQNSKQTVLVLMMMKHSLHMKLPLTIYSVYFGDYRETRSINPKTLARYVETDRRGDDWIKIRDAIGNHYLLADRGKGVELLLSSLAPARQTVEEADRDAYNRDLALRARNGQVGSGMTYRP